MIATVFLPFFPYSAHLKGLDAFLTGGVLPFLTGGDAALSCPACCGDAMRCDVNFIFTSTRKLDVQLNMAPDTELAAASQQWLVQKWEELDCEPLRASGKVLVLDRILGITDALGYDYLLKHDEQRETLARHCVNALGSHHITVDLPGMSVKA